MAINSGGKEKERKREAMRAAPGESLMHLWNWMW